MQTRIKDKGLDLYLEVRKEKKDAWVRRDITPEETEEEPDTEDFE